MIKIKAEINERENKHQEKLTKPKADSLKYYQN